MDFDPDAYLAGKKDPSSDGFDPDAYLARKSGGHTEEKGLYMPSDRETTTLQDLKRWGGNTMGALAKWTSGLRSASTGPATAALLEKLSGKKVFNAEEWKDALNLTNLKQGPSNAELFKRAGWNNPVLSDIVPGYAKPGTQHPFYQPEKGGMLDPGVAGALQMATDPAMYTGLGEAALMAKGLPRLAQAARYANNTVNPLSMTAKFVGKDMYESPLLHLEQQGERKAKEGIAQTLYEGGVKTPRNLPENAQRVASDLMNKRDRILNAASNAGGKASQEEAVAGLKSAIAKIRATQDPAQQAIADKMEERLNKYLAVERGTPGKPPTPDQIVEKPSPILDEHGQPFINEEVIPGDPGTPGVAPKVVTPMEASGYKTSIYKTQPKTYYNTAGQSDLESEMDALLAQGELKAAQTGVKNTLGENAANQVAEYNRKAGGIFSTQGAQQTISDRAGRQANTLKELTPADVITMAAGAAGGGAMGGHTLEGAAVALALKKVASAVNQSKMPAGYYLRKTGASSALDRLNEALAAQAPTRKRNHK